MTEEQQFDLAVGLILSYYFEGTTDAALPKILALVAEVAPAAFVRVMVLAAAIKTEGFDERYGLADPGEVLRTFETTAHFHADVDRFLSLMGQANDSAIFEAQLEAAASPDNFYRAQARKFMDEFGLNATSDDLNNFLRGYEQ
jgi:hypothetical protein